MPTEDDPISDDDATSTSSHSEGVFEAEPAPPDAALKPHSEVLSGVMDEHETDSTGELELPGIADDLEPQPAKSDPGFDGWLDDDEVAESGDDPSAALTDEDADAAAEIADWVAFTSGAGAESSDAGETDVVVDVTDDSIAAASADADDSAVPEPAEPDASDEDRDDSEDEPHEDTIEFFLDEQEEDLLDDEAAATPDAADELESEPEAELDREPDEDPDEESDAEPDIASSGEPVVPAGASPPAEPGHDAEADVSEAPDAATAAEPDDAEPDDAEPDDAEPDDAEPDDAEPYDAEPYDAEPDDAEPLIDPDELQVLPVVTAAATPSFDDDSPLAAADADVDDDDTGEIPIVGGVPPRTDEPDDEASVYDFSDFSDDRYVQKGTREHQDLAAAIEQADAEDTQQVAVSAAIPGLESGVVGFDDVVAAAEGEAAVAAAPRRSSDILVRVGTGAALVVAFLLSLLWRPAITVLALAAFVIAAGEFYSALMHRRYKPMSIFGFVGIIGAGLGAVVWGVVAIPIAFGLLATVILLYDAVSRRRTGAVSGFVLTVLVAGWIGGFGAFAFPIIASDDFQVLVLTVVAIVALVDIAAYFVGSSIGRRHFAPTISPKKTVEGLVGGTLMALLAGAAASFFVEAIDLPTGLVLGAVVAVVGPLGDLAVSVVKRSLDIKDMGSILPGHGGLLDRIDAIIAVVPAAWAVFVWTGLL